jgi:hypothetical protein
MYHESLSILLQTKAEAVLLTFPLGGMGTLSSGRTKLCNCWLCSRLSKGRAVIERLFDTGQSRKNVANYPKQTLAYEEYLVAETVMIGKQQVIRLLYPVNIRTPDSANLKNIRDDKVRRIKF